VVISQAPAGRPDDGILDVGQVYERHRDELRSFFANVTRGRLQIVEDLVQNVYLRLLEYPPSQVLREPQAYLFKLAWTELHRYRAKNAHEPVSHDHEALDSLSAQRHSSQMADDASGTTTEQLLLKVLGDLPTVYGQVFVMFKWDGRSYKQIAAELQLTPRQVKRYIARTLQRLKLTQSQD
jgi:RNA polymerase sigma factor (sigma-70 family)